ncbi:DnaA ATPase domain-containing protein [Mameliella sediminis]|uniref:DnaA ATPase domain-containing protein n=1 Tax=Mameliella sediminis TaxID=2836866 RepID=UPI001C458099|nr:DnaA/Hda family protein [Mameliella sediminis]MBY6115782.1 chromosomal replication initiator DnaA [Antarctobacter heliothermus]MBY6145440.1 chromosomal replication initiator DnaA [Mameliella alba]MBV7393836.1 chromosomal replication initiator DnaA [Mameliella sediminis]MBY6162250.1 chromosomal replication initiator DnaA [Mameliella alba]MBY6170719.1 chromosomal replication initiator DnaA [Mameliella alba]
MKPTSQLPLPLPSRTARGREDFFVSPANALAVAQIEGWRGWPAHKMIVAGPAGSGKTHLAHVWAGLSGASIVKARDLTNETLPDLASGPVCVEDIEEIAGDRGAEEMLFHLHNLVLAGGGALMVTATRAPVHWPLVLPDLKSRMMGAQVAQISEPDDALLVALLAKLFADRQLVPGPEVLSYLVRHMPRSYATAARLVAALDAEALAHQRDISRPMAVRVLQRLVPPGAEDRGTSRNDPGGQTT